MMIRIWIDNGISLRVLIIWKGWHYWDVIYLWLWSFMSLWYWWK